MPDGPPSGVVSAPAVFCLAERLPLAVARNFITRWRL
jgi:hypothetical protein